MLNKIRDFLWILFHPRFWLITDGDRYCSHFDAQINALLDSKARFNVLSEYEATLGSYRLWIANYPYACFTSKVEHTLTSSGRILSLKVRPKRRTIYRLRQALVLQEPILEHYL